MRKEIENPRYATNSDTQIKYDEVSYDDEGNRKGGEIITVDEGSDEFSSIVAQFGEEELIKNKELDLEKTGSPSGLTSRSQLTAEDNRKKDEQMKVFLVKSFLFETKLLRGTDNKELRRNIRRAQSSEEALMSAMVLLMDELFGLKADPEKVAELMTTEEQDD